MSIEQEVEELTIRPDKGATPPDDSATGENPLGSNQESQKDDPEEQVD